MIGHRVKNIFLLFTLITFYNSVSSQTHSTMESKTLTYFIYIGGKPSKNWVDATKIVANRWGFNVDFLY